MNYVYDYQSAPVVSKVDRIKTLFEPYIKETKIEDKVKFLENGIVNRKALKSSLLRSKHGIQKQKKRSRVNNGSASGKKTLSLK